MVGFFFFSLVYQLLRTSAQHRYFNHPSAHDLSSVPTRMYLQFSWWQKFMSGTIRWQKTWEGHGLMSSDNYSRQMYFFKGLWHKWTFYDVSGKFSLSPHPPSHINNSCLEHMQVYFISKRETFVALKLILKFSPSYRNYKCCRECFINGTVVLTLQALSANYLSPKQTATLLFTLMRRDCVPLFFPPKSMVIHSDPSNPCSSYIPTEMPEAWINK